MYIGMCIFSVLDIQDQSTYIRRCLYGQELLSHTPMVIEFLLNESEKYIDGVVQLHERNRKLLRCLLSWVQAGCLSEISAPSLPAHPLLSFVFNSLQQSRSFGHHYIQGATYSSRVSGKVKIFCLLKAK
nr:PREDICTED: uncharacterized protein LOC108193992 isoform X2 [Daucus carota subsp. sativus]XP_017216354.1 PREDICTED: uncharacterized protein LOC108193992 isoform X2 [Daucus carota subsp. sativus]XP_017216355.1 PREDICTED: uncharacterized protein LOC108193992 isoform X2 [Daucus carota subsp. sativus]XP_017216356.1 PREDICTED: uncharacterized protein LOC108193992 isoform X2 [Daucus carota subsp. sativus]